jgi:hypothetical protein
MNISKDSKKRGVCEAKDYSQRDKHKPTSQAKQRRAFFFHEHIRAKGATDNQKKTE